MRMVRISSPPRTRDLKTILPRSCAADHAPAGGSFDGRPTPAGSYKLPCGVFLVEPIAAILWASNVVRSGSDFRVAWRSIGAAGGNWRWRHEAHSVGRR